MIASSPLVEVRMPTYRRPRLLMRALKSLQAQTHQNWRCFVLDDSPDRDGQAICSNLEDSRIVYTPNATTLGICQNIDNAFAMPTLSESSFVCVLEDDNYYLPENIERNINTLEQTSLDILLRNQSIERMTDRDSPGLPTDSTTYSDQYTDGKLAHGLLFASFFYSTGANNSSLFWRTNVRLDFSTLRYSDDVVIQERLRTLCIDRDVFVAMQPLIVWRDNGPESFRPKLAGFKWYFAQARVAAQERAIYQSLYGYLISKEIVEPIFYPPSGTFSRDRERVFHRVGLPVPSRHCTFSRTSQISMTIKRIGALVLAGLMSPPREIALSTTKGRLL